MHTHNHKLEAANVVAVFDTQDEADEAVLGLRVAGFRDDQIGYFARNLAGLVTDYLGQTYATVGAVLGTLLGAALGVWAGWEATTEGATPIGPPLLSGPDGVILTCALCGAILGGIIGAMLGWGIPRGDAVYHGSEVEPGRFVIAVTAGDRADEAWAIIRRYGGYEARPAGPAAPGVRTPTGYPV
ncbi:MAG: hypothetical protein JWO38_974 [Gemmataceae bacterium]|nr:hypothetical protein [Gemmataceae bacterium]